jgi:hypothetical protein
VKRFYAMWCLPALVLIGCADPTPAPPELASLASPAVVISRHADQTSRVAVVASGGLSSTPSDLTLPIGDLSLRLRTGERAQLEQLDVPLGDVSVSADTLPPNGLQLRDLRLSLAQPVRAEVVHAQPDALELKAMAPLELAWSLVLADGSLYPLGRVRTEPLALDLAVVRSADGIHTTLSAHCPGTCWSLDGIANLRDGDLYLEAAAALTPQP